MISFSVTRQFTLEIGGIEGAADQLRVKRLPLRQYDPDRDKWIVPIRPGLAEAIRSIFGFEMDSEIWITHEIYFLELIEPPVNVDPWKVSAAQACELATMYHFYKFHNGNREEYTRIHAPYVMGE